MQQKPNTTHAYYALGIIAMCLSPWLILQYNLRIPADAAFLYSGALMMLEGKAMSEFYYDNNPPMSFMIYIPAALLHTLGGLAKHDSIQIYTLSFIGICSIFTTYLLSLWRTLSLSQTLTILGAYTAVLCIFAYREFGQKDHLLAIALFPFVLAQLTLITQPHTRKTLPVCILLLCMPFLIIKPHYFILPCALICYRLYASKSILTTIKAPDIWIIGLSCIAYLAAIYLITPDFISAILPNSLKLYVETALDFKQLKVSIAFLAFTAFLLFYAVTNNKNDETSTLAIFFSIAACLSLIPFIVQNKGFSLHLYPSLAFIAAALFLNAQSVMVQYVKTKKNYGAYIPAIALLSVLYGFFFISKPIPNKSLYTTSSPLTALLREKAGTGSFIFEATTTNIFHTHALYLDNEIGTRFPSLWFLTNFVHRTTETQKYIWETFGTLMAEDIKHHKPRLIALASYDNDDEGLLAFFQNHSDFITEWQYYRYDGKFTLDANDYNAQLFTEKPNVTYDLYIRHDQTP